MCLWVPLQPWTAVRHSSSGFACAAMPQQEAESPAASRDGDADAPLDFPPPAQQRLRGGNGAARSPMMTTLEQNDSIEALDSVQSKEAIIEDRGEWVFTLVGAALAFGAGVWAVLGACLRFCQDSTRLRGVNTGTHGCAVHAIVFDLSKHAPIKHPHGLWHGRVCGSVIRRQCSVRWSPLRGFSCDMLQGRRRARSTLRGTCWSRACRWTTCLSSSWSSTTCRSRRTTRTRCAGTAAKCQPHVLPRRQAQPDS